MLPQDKVTVGAVIDAGRSVIEKKFLGLLKTVRS